MSFTLPDLPNFIAVPDYPTHCPFCNLRASLISDFYHTNYKGVTYECQDCEEKGTYLFVDQEDKTYSIDYWQMNPRDRRSYQRLTAEQISVFSTMNEQDKVYFLSMKAKARDTYIKMREKEKYLSFSLTEEYVNSLSNWNR